MLHMLYAIHDFKERAEISANCFAKLHPFVFFLSVFIGMPFLTLGAVFLFSSVLVVPMALVLGWT